MAHATKRRLSRATKAIGTARQRGMDQTFRLASRGELEKLQAWIVRGNWHGGRDARSFSSDSRGFSATCIFAAIHLSCVRAPFVGDVSARCSRF